MLRWEYKYLANSDGGLSQEAHFFCYKTMETKSDEELEAEYRRSIHYKDVLRNMKEYKKLFTGFKNKLGKNIYEGDTLEYEYTLDQIQKKKVVVEWNKEVGAWYAGGEMLCNVLHEQNNDEWKKTQNYIIREEQYIK